MYKVKSLIREIIFNYAWIILLVGTVLVFTFWGRVEAIDVIEKELENYEMTTVAYKEPVVEEQEEELYVFDIPFSDFEKIHSEAILYLRDEGYEFRCSKMHGNGSKIVFEVLPSDNYEHDTIETMRNHIQGIFYRYHYDVDVKIWVLNVNNIEVVDYSTI